MNVPRFPHWVRDILREIKVTIYRGKTDQKLKNRVSIMGLPYKVLSSDVSKGIRKVFVIGFEDEEDIWNERSDIVVKIYELQDKTYRVEIFCSSVNKKEIYYREQQTLAYEGYSEDDAKHKKTVIGTVIFDVSLQ